MGNFGIKYPHQHGEMSDSYPINVKGREAVNSTALVTFPSCSEEHADQL